MRSTVPRTASVMVNALSEVDGGFDAGEELAGNVDRGGMEWIILEGMNCCRSKKKWREELRKILVRRE